MTIAIHVLLTPFIALSLPILVKFLITQHLDYNQPHCLATCIISCQYISTQPPMSSSGLLPLSSSHSSSDFFPGIQGSQLCASRHLHQLPCFLQYNPYQLLCWFTKLHQPLLILLQSSFFVLFYPETPTFSSHLACIQLIIILLDAHNWSPILSMKGFLNISVCPLNS